MKKIKILTLTAATLAVMHVSANAAMPLPGGWYLEGNIGTSQTNNATYAKPSRLRGGGLGWNVDAGYKFLPFFAGELGFTRYASAIARVGGTQVVVGTHYSYDLAGKGILPLGETGAELFAKVGVARIQTTLAARNGNFAAANGVTVYSGSQSVTGYYFGLGGDYSIWPTMAVNVQWDRSKGNTRAGCLDLYSVGLNYIFG